MTTSPKDQTQVSRDNVRDFYSKAAVSTQESLCCPVSYDPTDLSHIPKEVMEISYGCGSPVNRANLSSGESLVDLGSGGGIDCFIAAKIVGASGQVTGIDMTEKMLQVAKKNSEQVSKNLGFNNLEFKQGFLESIPMEDESVNVVTSNCVVNLSTDKKEVFSEIHRILKPGGRFVIADIISDQLVPEEMKNNKELWGECISGALTLEEFLSFAKNSNFHGFTVYKDYLWKKVEGLKFYSYIITGFKPLALEELPCCASDLIAIYSGPFPSVKVQGTDFAAGASVTVDQNMAKVLDSPPYRGMFNIIDPDNESIKEADDSCCG